MAGTLDLDRDAGEREAPLARGALGAVRRDDLGVDEHVGVLLGALARPVDVNDHDLLGNAHLRGGETAAVGGIHVAQHALGKGANLVVDLLDGRALLGENGCGRENDFVQGVHCILQCSATTRAGCVLPT